jgi:hypothetical protein
MWIGSGATSILKTRILPCHLIGLRQNDSAAAELRPEWLRASKLLIGLQSQRLPKVIFCLINTIELKQA